MSAYTFHRKPEKVTAVHHEKSQLDTFERLRDAGLMEPGVGFAVVGLDRARIQLANSRCMIAVADLGDWIIVRGDGEPVVMGDAEFRATYGEDGRQTITIPPDAVNRVWEKLSECGLLPYGASVNDFTPAEIAEGKLSVADQDAERLNLEFCKEILSDALAVGR